MTRIPETYTYKTVGELNIKADVYRSAAADSPVIVYIHGGCLIYGSRKNIPKKQTPFYQDAGFAVVSIDYRLAPESKLPDIITDLRDAFLWVYDSGPSLFGIDSRQTVAVGHSAGGYLALMSGFCVQPRPKAIISFYGYGDIVGDWYAKPDPFYCQQPRVSEHEAGNHRNGPVISEPYKGRGKDKFYLWCRQNGLWPQEVGGQSLIENPTFFEQYCPVRNVTSDYPPTLLLHGDRDTDVPYQQSVQMAEVLSGNGVENELIIWKGKGHGLDFAMGAPLVKDSFVKVLDFLNRHTGRAKH